MSLEDLRLLTPWPETKPNVDEFMFGWCEQCHQDVFSHYLKNCKIYLEIGAYLGKSVKLALDCLPKDSVVVAIDPWVEKIEAQHLQNYDFKLPIASRWETFCINLWEFKDRIIPLKGLSQMRLFDVYNLNVQPDVIYIDGHHTYHQVITDLEMCWRFFPNALILGDDWNLKENGMNVAQAVYSWCILRGFKIQVHKNRVFKIVK